METMHLKTKDCLKAIFAALKENFDNVARADLLNGESNPSLQHSVLVTIFLYNAEKFQEILDAVRTHEATNQEVLEAVDYLIDCKEKADKEHAANSANCGSICMTIDTQGPRITAGVKQVMIDMARKAFLAEIKNDLANQYDIQLNKSRKLKVIDVALQNDLMKDAESGKAGILVNYLVKRIREEKALKQKNH
jgi:hypothetical protein